MEKELDDQKIQDGMGKEDKENTGMSNENNGSENEGEDDNEEDAGMEQKEESDPEGRDENMAEVEAEVGKEMGERKSTNGMEADVETEALSSVKNGEVEGEEMKKRGEENYHLHNGLDEQEPSTNELQDENGIDVKDTDSANQE